MRFARRRTGYMFRPHPHPHHMPHHALDSWDARHCLQLPRNAESAAGFKHFRESLMGIHLQQLCHTRGKLAPLLDPSQ